MSSYHSLSYDSYLLIKKILTRVHQESQWGAEVVSQLWSCGVTHLGVQTALDNNVSDSDNEMFVFIHQ